MTYPSECSPVDQRSAPRRMPWSRDQIRAARQMPLEPVLVTLGYQLLPQAHGNYVVAGLPDEVIVKGHYWICAQDGRSGNAIDFLVMLLGKSFTQAVGLLLDGAESSTRPNAS